MSFATFKKTSQNDKKDSDLELGGQDKLSATLNLISTTLSEFTNQVSQISKQEAILGTKRDTPTLRTRVDDMITNCKDKYSKLIENLDYLDDLMAKPDIEKKINDNDNEIVKIKFSKDLLRQQVHDVYKNYQVIIRSYNEKIKSALVQEQYEQTIKSLKENQNKNKNKENNTVNQGIENKSEDMNNYSSINDKTPLLTNNSISMNQYQTQKQIKKKKGEISESNLQYHSDLIQQRDEAITSLSQGVQDINKIFKDLDQMVNHQGEQIDSIENNMINYATNNQLASHELTKADNYQKSKRKWTCILLFALIIILLIFLAIIS